MKLAPFTVEVPEHYAVFMREVESVLPGEWARWAKHIIDQALRDAEHGQGEGEFLSHTLEMRRFANAGEEQHARKKICSAWKLFVSAEVSAAIEALQ